MIGSVMNPSAMNAASQGISYISHSRGVPSLPMMLGGGNQPGMHIPPTLDSLNDFPSLGDPNINQFSSAQMASRTDYSGMVRDNGMAPVNQIEFNIQTEDFPALPGVPAGSAVPTNPSVSGMEGSISGGSMTGVGNVTNQSAGGLSSDAQNSSNDTSSASVTAAAFLSQQQQHLLSQSSQSSHEYSLGTPLLNACYKFACHPDFEKEVSLHYSQSSTPTSGNNADSNSTSNRLFPKSLLKNPYGMLGLLQSIREKPFYGVDLTTLGQEVNASDKCPMGGFATSLFCDIKPRAFEREASVPDEYNVWNDVGPKMPKLQQLFAQFSEESLFIHFYLFSGSKYQRFAANELYQRDWRFHKSEKIWIRRKNTPYEEQTEYECGLYYYFDFNSWKLSHKEMRVVYQSLELDPRSEDSVQGFVSS